MSGKRLLERDDEFDTDADREPCGWGCGHRRGTAVYKASGYFGGYSDHDDSAALTMSYLGVSNNNAYADNLSLVLNTPAAASTFLGCNLIVNGDAEAGIPIPPGNSVAFDIPGWVRTANFTTDTYVDSGEVSVKDPGPADRGKFLFFGGPENEASSAFQDIDISPLAAQVDSGSVRFAFGGWVGGYSSQEDFMVLTTKFLDWAGNTLGSSQLGPVSAANRSNIKAILQKAANGAVPAGTRQIQVRMDSTRREGLYNVSVRATHLERIVGKAEDSAWSSAAQVRGRGWWRSIRAAG